MLTRLLAFILIAESLFGALRVAGLLPVLAAHDAIAALLIVLRGLLGAWQFIGGWLLASNQPQGLALARGAFLAGAILTPFDVGLGLAPTSIYPWYRWHVTAAYTVMRATQLSPETLLREDSPMVPRQALGIVGMYELEGRGRLGIEVYHTGPQALDHNPYRSESPSTWIVGALVERRLGNARWFLNLENLTDEVYRGISWGMDAPGRGITARYVYRF